MKYMNKELNTTCYCEKRLWYDDICIIYPCEHMIHDSCSKKLKRCPICFNYINKIYHEDDISNVITEIDTTKIFYQQYIDMFCIKRFYSKGYPDYSLCMSRMSKIFNIISRILSMKSQNGLIRASEQLFNSSLINLTVKNKNKLYPYSKILIANHSSYLDGCIVYKATDYNCKFLVSSTMKEEWLGDTISSVLPTLMIDRGTKTNTVQKMTNYLNNKNTNCLAMFPEGFITHPKTIARFRTGAFRTPFPIQPIVIEYDPILHLDSMSEFIFYLTLQKKLNVTVTYLDPIFPPFNVEHVRKLMGKVGGMCLSRVIGRDIKD
jgi:hypothetical protein